MNFIQKLLYQEKEPETNREIIIWWEKKRLIYNIAYLPFLGLWFYISKYHVTCYAGTLNTPLVIIIIIGLNVCYTSGWLFEIIVRYSIVNFTFKSFAPFLFLIGTLGTVLFIVVGLLSET